MCVGQSKILPQDAKSNMYNVIWDDGWCVAHTSELGGMVALSSAADHQVRVRFRLDLVIRQA